MSKTPINDGLTKYERYRLKDVEAYRAKKRDHAKTDEQRRKRCEYMRAWREKNRARHNELARESHARNKHKHVEKKRAHHFMTTYGLTLEERDALIKSQDGKCKICQEIKPLHCDHDHTTGEFRGMICMTCNTHLGWYEKVGKQAIEDYLKG
jgi:hypothetical protein